MVASIAAAAASSVGVTPQAEAPSSAPVAPRNALRRRLRRRTCTARARTQRHRFVLRARAGQSLRVRAQLLRSARASKRAAKGAGRSMANGEMVGSSVVRRRAWSRPQRGAEARIAQRQKGWRSEHELKGVRASTLKGCCARLFQGPQDLTNVRSLFPCPFFYHGTRTNCTTKAFVHSTSYTSTLALVSTDAAFEDASVGPEVYSFARIERAYSKWQDAWRKAAD